MNYDIIGDIHGHADALQHLLRDLGYRETRGAWRHPDRQAIFVGDFIDRGPQQLATVDLVRRMIDSGTGRAVMGNHEFNAIAFYLPDPQAPGEYLRKHSSPKYGSKNREQHKAFLNEAEGTPRHKEVIDWFLTLPVFLDLPELRVVHACWHAAYLDYLKPHLTLDGCLTEAIMVPASREPDDETERDTLEPTIFKAVETLLKGIEVNLPAGKGFNDKDGHPRKRVRVRWWEDAASGFRDLAMLPDAERKALPDDPVPDYARIGYDGKRPVFVGHYWLTGAPALLSETVACVDYSVAKGGRLVAYRWDGEPTLDSTKFHWTGA
jgi:hypothetical protein